MHSRQLSLPSLLTFITLLTAQVAGGEPAIEPSWDYGTRGLEWSAPETDSYLWLGLRLQPRYASNFSGLQLLEDFDEPETDGGRISRARYKIGAGFRGVLTTYHEYDLRNSRLLDLRTTWTPSKRFNLRVGQWKSPFSRERIDSSGKQQFVDRSIANYYFTVDRQWGAVASGRIDAGGTGDSNWWVGVLGGNGRNEAYGEGPPMWLGRWQWNHGGGPVSFSQGALTRRAKPRSSLAFAGIVNDSPYTRYSSSGGGQLPGYPAGDGNRYRIRQLMQEWAYRYRGISLQQELHWKSIEDRSSGDVRELYGGYVQGGWFPSDRWQHLPEQWELALRLGYVNLDFEGLSNSEATVASNWFFHGHRNKLTAELAWRQSSDADSNLARSEWVFRAQWDISI